MPLALLDRVDGWLGLYGAPRLTTTPALLEAGAQVLGQVLRDAGRLADRLDALPAHEDFSCRALAVALGLLGMPESFDVACPDGENGDDAAAWALCVITVGWQAAGGRVEEGVAVARGEARSRLDVVLARLAMGNALSAIG